MENVIIIYLPDHTIAIPTIVYYSIPIDLHTIVYIYIYNSIVEYPLAYILVQLVYQLLYNNVYYILY